MFSFFKRFKKAPDAAPAEPLGPTTRTISAPNGDSVFEGSNPNEESMPTKVTAPHAQLFLAI
ncbi:hypothetical protein [Burkholderia pseudomallei]|uniref:hypothetical protein n=1 Tax=Burkholderia pseudomallei TaxID=28450 RepID=UPI003AF91219